MSAAVAIVLLLNGVQVDLPVPALLINGASHVPVRAVCERVGAKVVWRRDTIVIDVAGRAVVLSLQPPGKAAPQGCCMALGAVYAAARHLAQLLGGQAKWRPDTRSVEMWLPPAATPEDVAAVRSLANDPLAARGRVFSVSGRYAGARGLSPTAPAAELGADGFLLEREGVIYCSTQDYHVLGAPSPFSHRGRAFRVTGQAALQATGVPALKLMALQTDPQAAPATARIDLVTQHVSVPNPIRVRVMTSDPAFGDAVGASLRIVSPAGTSHTVSLPRTLFQPVPGAQLSGPMLWEAIVDWPVPASEGRDSAGVWRVQLHGGPTDPGLETAASVDPHDAPGNGGQ